MPTTRMRTRAMTPIVQAAGSSLVPPGGTGEASRPPPKFSRAGARDFRTPTTMAVASLRPEPSGRHSRLDGALAFQSPPRSPPLCSVASQTASPRWAGSTVGEPVEVMKRFRGACSFSTWFASGMIIPHRHPSSA